MSEIFICWMLKLLNIILLTIYLDLQENLKFETDYSKYIIYWWIKIENKNKSSIKNNTIVSNKEKP